MGYGDEELSTPSLGITQSVIRWVIPSGVQGFQLPLSGSRLLRTAVYQGLIYATFNSLSRDHDPGWPSVKHLHFEKLSTPSLGITEPDSGIFRLSAAFRRGTPSHR
jgi:hypothetical protein